MSDENTHKKSELTRNAQKALNAKKSLPDPTENRPETRTSDEGMNSLPRKDAPPSGALDQEGQRPVLERSRKVR